jgi:thioesterase domain-containing protein
VGESVALLALFDTNGPGYPQYLPSTTVWERRLGRLRHRTNLHWENLRATPAGERLGYVRIKILKWGQGFVMTSWRDLRRSIRRWRAALDDLFLPTTLRQVRKAGHWAAYDYRPKPYAGHATLFRATTQPHGIVLDRSMGWSTSVLGRLDIVDTPGHHGAIVRDPRARVLAQQLEEALQRARTKP